MNLKSNFLYRYLKQFFVNCNRFYCDYQRKKFIPQLQKILSDICKKKQQSEITIISSNCFAGRIMQDLGLKYNSPTLGLYFWAKDYIEFLSHLKYYLTEAKIKFVEHSKYPLGDERRNNWKHWYPIGVLDDKVEIHFLHYHSEEEAAEKWYRRASRVNFDNLLIIGMDQNICTQAEIEAFDKLPYENKIFFSRYNLKCDSNEFMPEFQSHDSVGDPYRKGHIFYRHLISHFSDKIQ